MLSDKEQRVLSVIEKLNTGGQIPIGLIYREVRNDGAFSAGFAIKNCLKKLQDTGYIAIDSWNVRVVKQS